MPTVEETSPKSVKVNVTAGTGMDIDWKDGHHSHYSFQYLRDACPCALCNDERVRENREPGQPEAIATGHAADVQSRSEAMVETAGVGKYAIRFTWNDGHEHGIYSWEFLREFCPCAVCNDLRTAAKAPGSGRNPDRATLILFHV